MEKKDRFESLKLVRKDEFNESNFQLIDTEAKKIIDNAPPEALLVLTITDNSPTLAITKAEPFTEHVFDRLLKEA